MLDAMLLLLKLTLSICNPKIGVCVVDKCNLLQLRGVKADVLKLLPGTSASGNERPKDWKGETAAGDGNGSVKDERVRIIALIALNNGAVGPR